VNALDWQAGIFILMGKWV